MTNEAAVLAYTQCDNSEEEDFGHDHDVKDEDSREVHEELATMAKKSKTWIKQLIMRCRTLEDDGIDTEIESTVGTVDYSCSCLD